MIPLNDVQDYEKLIEKVKNCLSTQETARRLGYQNHASITQLITRSSKFPNAFKYKGKWQIPISDVQEVEKAYQLANRKIEYTGTLAFRELKEFIDSIEINNNLRETKQLFINYCLLQTNNMQGTNRYRRDRALLFQRFYKNLAANIDDEIFLLSSMEIEILLDDKSPFSRIKKSCLLVF